MKERSRNPVTKKIARERIEILFDLAKRAFLDHPNGVTAMSNLPAG